MGKKLLCFLLMLSSYSCSSNTLTNSTSTETPSTANTFILPVDGNFEDLQINDSFGPRILSGVYDFHRGLDISRDLNDNIYAAADGTVIHAGTKSGFPRAGTFIILEHSNNQFTGYLHLNALATGVVNGATVSQGQLIGYAGDSGENINTIHLHFNYYVSTVSGEIPSDFSSTYPPLSILTYSDTSNHTITIDTVNSTNNNDITVTMHVSVPSQEMDLNEVGLIITNSANATIYSQKVNYANRTNCGTDEAETNNILITPENFVYPESTYDLDFTFGDIDLSTYTGQTLTLRATAIDVSGNEKVTTQALTL